MDLGVKVARVAEQALVKRLADNGLEERSERIRRAAAATQTR